ncbi:hypothetical protein LXL04_021192 [Taraxacum kok-saghyz]
MMMFATSLLAGVFSILHSSAFAQIVKVIWSFDLGPTLWRQIRLEHSANWILAVSLAICNLGDSVKNIPLYKHIANLAGNKKLVLLLPTFNVINGGSHVGNKLAMQEFMIFPVVYHNLKSLIKKKCRQDLVREEWASYFKTRYHLFCDCLLDD